MKNICKYNIIIFKTKVYFFYIRQIWILNYLKIKLTVFKFSLSKLLKVFIKYKNISNYILYKKIALIKRILLIINKLY